MRIMVIASVAVKLGFQAAFGDAASGIGGGDGGGSDTDADVDDTGGGGGAGENGENGGDGYAILPQPKCSLQCTHCLIK